MIADRRFPIQPVAVALVLALAGCDAPVGPETAGSALSLGPTDGSISKPFKARGVTVGQGARPDPTCGAPPRLLATQMGEGEGTHTGRFSMIGTFCVDFTDLLDDGQLTEGESLPYDNAFVTLTAADGSELFLEGFGVILPIDHPDFDIEFHDPYSIIGGTGRFSGASGTITVHGLAAQAASETYQELNGTLILPLRG